MLRMIGYEWKRIWMNRMTRAAAAGGCLFLVFCVLFGVRLETAVDKKGNTVRGLDAIEVMRKEQPEGILDQEEAEKWMREYLSYTENPRTASDRKETQYLSEEIYRTWYLPNEDILRMLTFVYGTEEERELSMKEIFQNHLGEDFSRAREDRVSETLSRQIGQRIIGSSEAVWWKEKDTEVGSCRYGYSGGWGTILVNVSWNFLIMMVVCIGVAPVFAGEYQSKCDSLLLCMKYGKSRLIKAKLAASVLYSTAVYWGIVAVYSGICLLISGTEGAELSIQTLKYYIGNSVSYDLTMSQAAGLALLMGYVMTLGLSGITLLFSSLMRNTYGVIVGAFLFLCIPMFLPMNTGGYIWKHVLGLLPEKIADFSFESYLVYPFPGFTLTWPQAAMVFHGILAVVCWMLASNVFRRHEVNS